ncbi:MAG TPA: hypothetical protein VI298_13695 [Geobacteraceae bacterium]
MIRAVRVVCLFVVVAAVVSLFLITEPRNAAAEGKGLRVVILVYSGRADEPNYQLVNPELVAQVKSLMGKAEKAEFKGQTIIPSILGYRGIMVLNQGGIPGIPEIFLVHKGMIETRGKEKSYHNDKGRQLELLLLKQAKKEKVLEDKLVRQMNIDMLK